MAELSSADSQQRVGNKVGWLCSALSALTYVATYLVFRIDDRRRGRQMLRRMIPQVASAYLISTLLFEISELLYS
jgi:hypothetical protein